MKDEVSYLNVSGFPGYQVGDDGSVWSCWEHVGFGKGRGGESRIGDSWHRLKGSPNKYGYSSVCLYRDGKGYVRTICRLVLEAFVGPRPDGMECRHFPDQDRTNNRVENLRWGTHTENMADRILQGTDNRGERCGNAKLTKENVLEIRSMAAAGVPLPVIATRFHVGYMAVWSVVRRKTWAHI